MSFSFPKTASVPTAVATGRSRKAQTTSTRPIPQTPNSHSFTVAISPPCLALLPPQPAAVHIPLALSSTRSNGAADQGHAPARPE